jgi:hypothetical protein
MSGYVCERGIYIYAGACGTAQILKISYLQYLGISTPLQHRMKVRSDAAFRLVQVTLRFHHFNLKSCSQHSVSFRGFKDNAVLALWTVRCVYIW